MQPADRNDDELEKYMMDRMMGVVFIKRANKMRYMQLLAKIRDQHTFNIYVYPKTLHNAYELLENHSSSGNKRNNKDAGRDRVPCLGRDH